MKKSKKSRLSYTQESKTLAEAWDLSEQHKSEKDDENLKIISDHIRNMQHAFKE